MEREEGTRWGEAKAGKRGGEEGKGVDAETRRYVHFILISYFLF